MALLSPFEDFLLVKAPLNMVLVVEPHFSFTASDEVIRIEYEELPSPSLLWCIPYKKYTNMPTKHTI
mgnify:CR=1 FL=1